MNNKGSQEKYNGYTNRETWATALHIDNCQTLYNMRRDIVTAWCHSDENSVYRLADALETWVKDELREMAHEQKPGAGLNLMFDDIGSLWRVCWDELASLWADDHE